MRVIRSVRRRWRARLLLRGAAIVVAAGFAVFLFSTFGIDRLRFEPAAVLAFRVVSYGAVLVLAAVFLIRPLLRRASDEQVARYLEEHEPSLEAGLLGAVQSPLGGTSPTLSQRLVEIAVDRCRRIDRGRRVERERLRRASAWLAGSVTAIALIVLLGPGFLGQAGPLILQPWASADAASPYSIAVEPGDILVPRGAEQRITARTLGFEATEVEVAVRRGEAPEWNRYRMSPDPEGEGFEILLFDLDEPTEYVVEAEGVRSPAYHIEVADLPYVDRIRLEYRFPAYTGLEPRVVEEGGDIAALRGTEVALQVTATLPVERGRLVFATVGRRDARPEDAASAPGGAATDADEAAPALELVPGGDGLTGELLVESELFYRVELPGPTGEWVAASPDYLIEPLDDQPPAVRIAEPGRDTKPTVVEEVFIEAEAEDDYGVGRLELVYAVNGGEEQTVVLHATSRGGSREVNRGHTLFLEEMELEPGDLIAYHARVRDLNAVGGRQSAVSDIYFLEIRPFDRSFRQADQSPAGGSGAGMGGGLSEQQRQIIAATFNVVRDRERSEADEIAENLTTLTLLQGRLRAEVEGLIQEMATRGVVGDERFRQVAEELPLAAQAMGEAEQRLGERRPEAALSPEQRALQHLLRAEAAFREVQVSMQQQGGGGGGGGPQAEELADLFELELDRLRNQYESVQRGEQRQRDEEVDAALQRLQELARRQQQLNERARARGEAAGGGRGAQGQLVEQTEELARRLERLSRQDGRPELEESARRLEQAADAMRRAAARGESGEAEGAAALERLREARRLLENRRAAALEREVEDAARRAERIVERQRELARDAERLGEQAGTRGLSQEAFDELGERKRQLAGEVAGLEGDLDRLARESRAEQRDASGELQRAANSIRENKLKEKILYSRSLPGQWTSEAVRNFEEGITGHTEELRDAVESARRAFGESDPRRLDRQLEETRDLVRGLESIQDRLRQRGEQAGRPGGEGPEASEPGLQGEPGQDEAGQQGQQGQAGQQGQEGQAGQQGQGGQEGEGGERGQGEAGGREGQGRPGNARAGAPGAAISPGGGGGRLTPDEVRQFQREFRQRREDAQRLRDELRGEGVDVGQLSEALRQLRALDDQRIYDDPEELARLQAAVIQGLKDFEFGLRRELGALDLEKLFLSGSDEVPEGYRELVERYYRSLSEDDGGR